ncbi:MAG: AMP-binding protein [Bacteroidaceae bacterium]|nr:AMP-binding protein [Bacteroidaceae bacterium]
MTRNQKIDDTSSMMRLIGNSIVNRWDEVAFSDYGSDKSYTYHDLFEKITRIHIFLDLYGVKPGDKIAICDKNCSNWAVAFLAIYTYNAVAVPLLPDFHINQIESLAEHSDSRLLLTNKTTFLKADKCKEIMIDTMTFRPFVQDTPMDDIFLRLDEEVRKRFPNGIRPECVSFEDENPDDLAVISYTSGSTGNPKGVMLSHKSFWSNNLFARMNFPLNSHHNCISLLPLAHMFGLSFEFIFPLTIGCHITFLTKVPSPNVVIKAFNELKPFMIILVPLIIEKIVRKNIMPILNTPKMRLAIKIPILNRYIYSVIRKKLSKVFGSSFYEVVFGGAALAKDVEALLHKIHFRFTSGYGMTECGPLIAYTDWKNYVSGGCGRPVDRMEIDILSDDPENVPGEIVCRGANLMMGYYKNPEATSEAVDKDGWLHTGDLGTIDRNGNIFIRGRKKNMLLGANGQNIYTEEIEDTISRHELVDECVVVQREQKLVALIYTSDKTLTANGMTRENMKQSLDAIRGAINNGLPKFAQISHIETMNKEFEKTPKKNIKRFLYK